MDQCSACGPQVKAKGVEMVKDGPNAGLMLCPHHLKLSNDGAVMPEEVEER